MRTILILMAAMVLSGLVGGWLGVPVDFNDGPDPVEQTEAVA